MYGMFRNLYSGLHDKIIDAIVMLLIDETHKDKAEDDNKDNFKVLI